MKQNENQKITPPLVLLILIKKNQDGFYKFISLDF